MQVRAIDELPALTSDTDIDALLSMVASEHFLGAPGTLALTAGEPDKQGRLWVMAVDRRDATVIADAVLASGASLRGMLPAIDVFAAGVGHAADYFAPQNENGGDAPVRPSDGIVAYQDENGVVAYGQMEDGRLSSAWRDAACVLTQGCESPKREPSLQSVALAATDPFRLAYLASVPLSQSRFAAAIRRRRSAVPGLALALSALATCMTIATLLSPGLRAQRDARRSRDELRRIAPSLARAAAERRISDSSSAVSSALELFRASGVDGLGTLLHVGEVLTDDAHVTSLSIDSLSAQVAVAGTSASGLLQGFAQSSWFDSVSVIGALSREPQQPRDVASRMPMPIANSSDVTPIERLTVRFVMRRSRTATTVAGTSQRVLTAIADGATGRIGKTRSFP